MTSKANLMQYENEDWVKSALDRHQEVGCNLDQDPSFVEHGGSILPVVLASISNMRPDDSLNIMLFFCFCGVGGVGRIGPDSRRAHFCPQVWNVERACDAPS